MPTPADYWTLFGVGVFIWTVGAIFVFWGHRLQHWLADIRERHPATGIRAIDKFVVRIMRSRLNLWSMRITGALSMIFATPLIYYGFAVATGLEPVPSNKTGVAV